MKRYRQFIGAFVLPLAVAVVLSLAGCGGGPSGGTPTSSLPNADSTAVVTGNIGSIAADSSLTGRQAAAVISDFSSFTVKARGISGTIAGAAYRVEGVPTDKNILIEISSGKILLKAYLPSVTAGKSSTKNVDLVTTAAAALWEHLGKPEGTSVESLENEYEDDPATAQIAGIVTGLTTALADPTVAATLASGESILDCAAVKGELEDAKLGGDSTAPTITAIYPNDGLEEIPSYLTTITLTFNEEMSSTVPTGITVVLEDDATGTVTIDDPTLSWGVQGKTLIIDHGTNLIGVGTLTAIVTLTPSAILDAAGNALSMPSSISDATVDGNDITIEVAVNNQVPPTAVPEFTPERWVEPDPVENTAEEIGELDTTFITTFDGGANIAESGATYLGAAACAECHESKYESWSETNHATAFQRKLSNSHFSSGCNYCHTVDGPQIPVWGDSGVDFAASEKPTRTLELGAFGMIPTDYSSTAPADVPEEMQSIQCENCHGPGSLHVEGDGDTDYIVGPSRASYQSTCAVCHDAPTHHVKSREWRYSGHSETIQNDHDDPHVQRASCGACHSGSGFIEYTQRLEEDSSVLITDGGNVIATAPTDNVACAACHDPHDATNEGQLRFPKETLCLQCHNGRRRAPGHGPHSNVQGRIFYGQGGVDEEGVLFWSEDPADPPSDDYEEGLYEGEIQPGFGSTMGATTCTDCHMHDESHTFKPSTEACQTCHPNMDAEEAIGYKQSLFAAALEPVVERLEEADADSGAFTAEQMILFERADFNLELVQDDGSEGVHNTPYVLYLINVASDFLTELGY